MSRTKRKEQGGGLLSGLPAGKGPGGDSDRVRDPVALNMGRGMARDSFRDGVATVSC